MFRGSQPVVDHAPQTLDMEEQEKIVSGLFKHAKIQDQVFRGIITVLLFAIALIFEVFALGDHHDDSFHFALPLWLTNLMFHLNALVLCIATYSLLKHRPYMHCYYKTVVPEVSTVNGGDGGGATSPPVSSGSAQSSSASNSPAPATTLPMGGGGKQEVLIKQFDTFCLSLAVLASLVLGFGLAMQMIYHGMEEEDSAQGEAPAFLHYVPGVTLREWILGLGVPILLLGVRIFKYWAEETYQECVALDGKKYHYKSV